MNNQEKRKVTIELRVECIGDSVIIDIIEKCKEHGYGDIKGKWNNKGDYVIKVRE